MKHGWLTAAAVAGMLALGPALAQETPGQQLPEQPQQQPQQQPQAGQPAETQEGTSLDRAAATGLLLVGKEVYSGRDEKVGTIKEVLQDQEGNIEAVLVEFGGIVGMGKKTVSIPADQMEVRGGRVIVPGMNRQQIQNLPAYR